MDRRIFENLLREHKDAIYGFAFYLLGNAEDAEDVTQDVFISLWNAGEEIEVKAAKWWLLRVCKNACLDLLRRRKVRQRAKTDGKVLGRGRVGIEHMESARREQILDVSDAGEGALQTELAMDMERVFEVMRGLKEPQQSIIILREMHDLSYEEIAETLELSMSAVKVYLHRARKKVRDTFAADNPAATPHQAGETT